MGRTHSNAFHQAPHFFDLPYRPVLKAICARNADRAQKFAANWGYESVETDWRKLIDRKDIDLIDIASTNDTHHEIAIAAAQGRQDGDVREAARPQRRGGQVDGRRRREGRRAERGLVQLPARARGDDAQAASRRGEVRAHLPLSREVPPGLDDSAGPAAGRRRVVAARCQGCRERRDRRPPRTLHRHGALAERLDHRGHRDDGDVRQGTEAQPHGEGRAGRHRRRERRAEPVRERLTRDVRGDALCARPQGALHARNQRRERLSVLGPSRPPSHSVPSIIATRGASAAGATSTSPTATSPT